MPGTLRSFIMGVGLRRCRETVQSDAERGDDVCRIRAEFGARIPLCQPEKGGGFSQQVSQRCRAPLLQHLRGKAKISHILKTPTFQINRNLLRNSPGYAMARSAGQRICHMTGKRKGSLANCDSLAASGDKAHLRCVSSPSLIASNRDALFFHDLGLLQASSLISSRYLGCRL